MLEAGWRVSWDSLSPISLARYSRSGAEDLMSWNLKIPLRICGIGLVDVVGVEGRMRGTHDLVLLGVPVNHDDGWWWICCCGVG